MPHAPCSSSTFATIEHLPLQQQLSSDETRQSCSGVRITCPRLKNPGSDRAWAAPEAAG